MLSKNDSQLVNDDVLTEVLNEHANALIRGEDNAAQLIEQYPASARLLEELFRLAGRICKILVPVEPSREFVNDLKAKLAEIQAGQAESAVRWYWRRKRSVEMSTVLGTAVSVLAVTALLTRVVGSVVMIIAFLVRRGRHRRSAAAA